MKVEVVEKIGERAAAELRDDAAVKLALQNFRRALQGDESLFDSRPFENLRVIKMGEGREACAGRFLLSLRGEETIRNGNMHFQAIQKLTELLKNAGSPEIFAAKLCLISETQDESAQKVFALKLELEAVGASSEQAALRWGLGVAHLQQALLFTSRYLRQQISTKKD